MIEVLEMGVTPVVEKIFTPIRTPEIGVSVTPKSFGLMGWIILLILLIGIVYFIYKNDSERPYKITNENEGSIR